MQSFWRIWAKALGEKSGASDEEADQVAVVRTKLVLFTIVLGLYTAVTNTVIIMGVWRHWDHP